MASSVKVIGLDAYLRPLKGKAFKDVNRELRQFSKLIAADIKPLVEEGVAASPAPQAAAMSKTVRVHSDRVPVVVVGKVNPRFKSGFRRGPDSRKRRGALAAGVVKGGRGGRRSTVTDENYYAPQRRDETWGALGRALRANGPVLDRAQDAYLRFYMATLKRYGFKTGRR